ncbi:MAG: acetyl-coenzyme A carboxylase carboxyl transferase subunit alpha [marine bacterium B5-7]|nr:MAG: acetyl-coenzyme A carboxylase carboxyl transferase subunit alpha [marine bacterium B5-7]
MNPNYLDFEQPLADLEIKIEELKRVSAESDLNLSDQIKQLEQKSEKLTREIFSSLSAWQITQLARHPKRPYTLDYINSIFSDFIELHGDRMNADDHAIVGGLAHLGDLGVVIIGHQKGRDTREKVYRNFGMPKPEGYRKAQRLMQLADRFSLPVITFIDTPGAYPGVDAEERGQSEAIARSIYQMSSLKVPVISVVIGEGGSGGALAIGVCDRLLMLSYSTYSVISPEGCASILWKSSDKAPEAADAMKMTSAQLKEQGFVDRIVEEPKGGAHRDPEGTARALRQEIQSQLDELMSLDIDTLLDNRRQKLNSYGRYTET